MSGGNGFQRDELEAESLNEGAESGAALQSKALVVRLLAIAHVLVAVTQHPLHQYGWPPLHREHCE